MTVYVLSWNDRAISVHGSEDALESRIAEIINSEKGYEVFRSPGKASFKFNHGGMPTYVYLHSQKFEVES